MSLGLQHHPAPMHEARPDECGQRRRRFVLGALAAWSLVVALSILWPQWWPLHRRAGISAAPFYAHWAWIGRGWLLVAVAVGIGLVVGLPVVFERLALRLVPVATGVIGSAWATTVAVAGGGWRRLWLPLVGGYDYIPFAWNISPGSFVRTYVERAGSYPTHVKSHPPGVVLWWWLVGRAGLGTGAWAAVIVLVWWAVGLAAVVWTVAQVAGPAAARRAAPFAAVMPGVLFAATSADAMTAGVTASAIAVLIAASSATGRRSLLLAAGGGVLWAFALNLSYGVAPLLLVPVAVCVARRRWQPLVIAGAIVAAVAAAFVAAGFWWLDGLSETHRLYYQGLARIRSYWYFVFAGNLGVLCLAAGPAAGMGVGRIVGSVRARPAVALVGALVVALVAADVSGMSKAEVERIWLPYTIWIGAAAGFAASAGASRNTVRAWLAAQVALTLGLQAWLVTGW